MTLHRVARENFNLLYSLGATGYGAGMVLLPLLAELLREAYGWRGGLLIISALMANIIPVGMAIKLYADESSPCSSPRFNEGVECESSTCQDTTGELDRKILVDRQPTRPAVSCDRHYRSREPLQMISKGQEVHMSVLCPFGLIGLRPWWQFVRRFVRPTSSRGLSVSCAVAEIV